MTISELPDDILFEHDANTIKEVAFAKLGIANAGIYCFACRISTYFDKYGCRDRCPIKWPGVGINHCRYSLFDSFIHADDDLEIKRAIAISIANLPFRRFSSSESEVKIDESSN